MDVYRDPIGNDEPPRGSVLSIGNFDGVHIGHQAVLRHVAARGAELETTGAALTLDPHPVKLLRPREAPLLVTTLAQRLQLIERTGIGTAMVVPFTHRLARLSAADSFLRQVRARMSCPLPARARPRDVPRRPAPMMTMSAILSELERLSRLEDDDLGQGADLALELLGVRPDDRESIVVDGDDPQAR